MKTLGAVIAAACLAVTISGPASAGPSVGQAEQVVQASAYVSVWHEPGHGYRTTDRVGVLTVDGPRHKALVACTSTPCRAAVLAYYRGLHRTWRAFNRSAWSLVEAFPVCAPSTSSECAYPPNLYHPAGVVRFDGVTYYANNADLLT